MANVDRPNGFKPIGTLSGSPWQASIEAFQLDASHTAIGVGDLVMQTADGYVNKYAAGSTHCIGVMVGVSVMGEGWNATTGAFGDNALSATEPTLVGLGSRSVALNTAGTILVVTAPDLVMTAQEDGVTTPLVLSAIGLNLEPTAGAIDASGNSTMELDSDTIATTNSLALRLLKVHPEPGNELAAVAAATPWCTWQVTFANHAYKGLNVGI